MDRQKHVMLYDGDCPMCTFQMRTIEMLDWWKKVELVPIKNPKAAAIAPDVTRADLLEAIHCVHTRGRNSSGSPRFSVFGLSNSRLDSPGSWFFGFQE